MFPRISDALRSHVPNSPVTFRHVYTTHTNCVVGACVDVVCGKPVDPIMVDVADPETAPFSVVDKPAPDAVVDSAVEETTTVVDPPATVDPLKNVVVGKGVVVGGGGTLGSRLSTRNISPSDSITTIVPVASLTSEYRPTDSGTIDNRRSGPPMFIGTLKFTSCVPTNTSTSSVGKSGEWKLTASPSAITDTPLKHANALPTHGSSVPLIDSRPSVVFRR